VYSARARLVGLAL